MIAKQQDVINSQNDTIIAAQNALIADMERKLKGKTGSAVAKKDHVATSNEFGVSITDLNN